MHEVAIAHEILEIVDRTARAHHAVAVTVVKIRIGKFTSVVKDALDFALEALKPETLAKDADFVIQVVPLHTCCQHCGKDFPDMDDYQFICLDCGGSLDIISGRELEITGIEIDGPPEV